MSWAFQPLPAAGASGAAAFEHIATGGVSFGGDAAAAEANFYEATAAGGIVFAGAAAAEEFNAYTMAATGGIVFNGNAAYELNVGAATVEALRRLSILRRGR